MVRRGVAALAIVALTVVAAAPPVLARQRVVGSITGADMIQTEVGDSCAVAMSATFAGIGTGRYGYRFSVHSARFGTTIQLSGGLSRGQASVSETMTVCDVGDTWDRLDVRLVSGGKLVDTETVLKTVVCSPR